DPLGGWMGAWSQHGLMSRRTWVRIPLPRLSPRLRALGPTGRHRRGMPAMRVQLPQGPLASPAAPSRPLRPTEPLPLSPPGAPCPFSPAPPADRAVSPVYTWGSRPETVLRGEWVMGQRRRIAGSRILITGASQGIGKALAELASLSGGKVLAAARSEDLLRELAEPVRARGGVLETVAAD